MREKEIGCQYEIFFTKDCFLSEGWSNFRFHISFTKTICDFWLLIRARPIMCPFSETIFLHVRCQFIVKMWKIYFRQVYNEFFYGFFKHMKFFSHVGYQIMWMFFWSFVRIFCVKAIILSKYISMGHHAHQSSRHLAFYR